jgi:predicted DNA-binding transcriptional regulator AlpA
MSVTALATKARRQAQPPINPTFLQTPEAAARLGLAPGTLDKMRLRGNGPAYLRLTPRRIVYAVDELDAWARARQFNSTSEYPTAGACA